MAPSDSGVACGTRMDVRPNVHLLHGRVVRTLLRPLIGLSLLFVAGCWEAAPTAPSSSNVPAFQSTIQHVVFILKENRSFDNVFGTYPGADGATSGRISTGERIQLQRAPD